MPTKLSEQAQRQIQEQGYGITGTIGGIKRQKYYTPDGREIYSVPNMREWSRKLPDGSVEGGIRDANFDNGWLAEPPQNPKLACPHCDKWHNTEEQIDDCEKQRKAFDAKWMRKAKNDLKQGSVEIEQLRSELDEVKEMLKLLLERGK